LERAEAKGLDVCKFVMFERRLSAHLRDRIFYPAW
jgi:hypothetical protein